MNLKLCEMNALPENTPHQTQPLAHLTLVVLNSRAAFLEGDT